MTAEPIEGRIIRTGQDAGYEAPPPVYHITVHLPPGDHHLNVIEAADTRPWWRPAYTLRTAIVAAAGLMPLPSIGAPAAHWALLVGDAAGEQSMGAGWTIAAAGIAGAFAVDRRVRLRDSRWDPDERGYRPGWLARGLLCAAISGACLSLPVFDTVVLILTGVQP